MKEEKFDHKEFSAKGGKAKWNKITDPEQRSKMMKKVRKMGLKKLSTHDADIDA